MPYQPSNVDIFAIPNWDKVHPDRHPRWISTAPNKMRGHMWDFGGGAYVKYGEGMTLEQLKEAAAKLGISPASVNTATGTIMVGDLVLAYISKAEFERRAQENLDQVSQRQEDAIQAHLATTRKGVKPRVFADEEEYKDLKNFNTRESNNRVGYRGASTR